MCYRCTSTADVTRRNLFGFMGATAASLAFGTSSFAQEVPKPQNNSSADEALERLVEGNRRYVDGLSRQHDFKNERHALARGQNPFAGILSCADSRVGPEYAFDTGRGDLFVCRVAGNFANPDVIASFE